MFFLISQNECQEQAMSNSYLCRYERERQIRVREDILLIIPTIFKRDLPSLSHTFDDSQQLPNSPRSPV